LKELAGCLKPLFEGLPFQDQEALRLVEFEGVTQDGRKRAATRHVYARFSIKSTANLLDLSVTRQLTERFSAGVGVPFVNSSGAQTFCDPPNVEPFRQPRAVNASTPN